MPFSARRGLISSALTLFAFSAFAATTRPEDLVSRARQEVQTIDAQLQLILETQSSTVDPRQKACLQTPVDQIKRLKSSADELERNLKVQIGNGDTAQAQSSVARLSSSAQEAMSIRAGANCTVVEEADRLNPRSSDQAPSPLPPPPSNGVPAAQLARQSTGMLSRMRTDFSEVATVLQTAVDTGDVVKKNCVNEKVTTVKGMINIAEKADLKLQQAAVERRQADAELEFEKVSIASTRTTEAKAKAQECMGMMAFGTDENQTVEVNEPDDLPKGDQTKPPTLPNVQTSNPPASPSL